MSKQHAQRIIAACHYLGYTATTVMSVTTEATDAFREYGLTAKLIKKYKPLSNPPNKYINKPRNNFKR